MELRPIATVDWRKEYAARLTSKRPADLRRKLCTSLDPNRDELPDFGNLGHLEPETAARHVKNSDVVFASVGVDENCRTPDVNPWRALVDSRNVDDRSSPAADVLT